MGVIGLGVAGGAGWIRIGDIVPQSASDAINNKVWQDAAETSLQSCRTSSLAVAITVQASSPSVVLDGNAFELAQATDGGHYAGTKNVTLSAEGNIQFRVLTPTDSDGASTFVAVDYEAPPQILTLSFTGGYPGSQTELKAGDTIQVTGTTDKNIDAIEVQNQDAGAYALTGVVTGTSFTASITIADRGDAAQALPAWIKVRDALSGGLSAVRATNHGGGAVDGTDVITLNDTHFTLSFGTPTYPGAQGALKDSESATVAITTTYTQTGANTIVYSSPNSQLSITNPTTHEATKTVQRIAGDYNLSTPNLQAILYRASNAAQTTVADGVVKIAHTTPTVDILLDAARLRSGGSDGTSAQDHRVRISADQQLLDAPSLAPDAGGNRGTFQGSAFTGGPSVWERDLRIDEAVPDEKGIFSFSSLVATGLAGRVQNTINSGASYTLGGFVSRNKTISALATQVQIATAVTDLAKLSVALITSTAQPGVIKAIATPPPIDNGITIDALDTNPTTLIWLDPNAASQNTGGTAQFQGVEESI